MQRDGKAFHQLLTRIYAAAMNDQTPTPPKPQVQRTTDVEFRVKGPSRHAVPNHNTDLPPPPGSRRTAKKGEDAGSDNDPIPQKGNGALAFDQRRFFHDGYSSWLLVRNRTAVPTASGGKPPRMEHGAVKQGGTASREALARAGGAVATTTRARNGA